MSDVRMRVDHVIHTSHAYNCVRRLTSQSRLGAGDCRLHAMSGEATASGGNPHLVDTHAKTVHKLVPGAKHIIGETKA